jgi:hypothetical protein
MGFERIECPVLLVWGTKDRVLPLRRYSARMRGLLPDAAWQELRGLGHVPMADDPELVASTIAGFVAEAELGAVAHPTSRWKATASASLETSRPLVNRG